MNNLIFTILFFSLCLFCSCSIKQYVNETEDTQDFLSDLNDAITKRKSGVYMYPNLKSKFTLKKGNFEGEFVYRHKNFNDTLFYAFFEKNVPKGYFINMTYKLNSQYWRLLHNELDRRVSIYISGNKQSISELQGKGILNENLQKEGFWQDPNYRGGYGFPKGYYKNGKKHGYWDELSEKGYYINGLRDGFWELYDEITTEKGYYKNDLREGKWIIEYKFDNENTITEKGYYKNNLREGEWIIEIRSPQISYLRDDGQWIIGDNGKKVYKEYYKKGIKIK